MESRHWGAAGPGEESEMKGCSLALEGGREQGGRDPVSGSSEGLLLEPWVQGASAEPA